MKTGQHGTTHYSVIQGFFWMAYCAGTGYSSTYLLSIGFENAQIGILIALSGLLAAVLQPSLAGMIDRSGKRLLKPVISGGVLVAILLSTVILFLPAASKLFPGICFAGNLTVMQLLIPLINSLSICGGNGKNVNFGFARAIGSVTYAGMSYLMGTLITGMGMEILSWARILSFLAMLAALYSFPVRYMERSSAKTKGEKQSGFFVRNPGFLTMMAGCFLLYLCHSFLTYYNYQIVLSKGGDEQTYGVVIALAAVLELPVMFGFSKMQKKADASVWFRLSGIGYLLKALGCLLAVNMTAYYCVQIFQMTAWALISVASVNFVKEVTAPEDSTRGQAFVTLSYTTAMAAGSLSGGFLLQLMDVNTMLLCASAFAGVGALVLASGVRKIQSIA